MLPLYDTLQHEAPVYDPKHGSGHAGLWFERFFDRYDTNGKIGEDKKDWLKLFAGRLGDADYLQQTALQQLALVEALGGQAQVFETDWHFVTGMGNPHPVENGLIWHPTAGVPYLSGAAMKGLVRSWLEVWEPHTDEAAQKQRLLSWFGSNHKDPKQHTLSQSTSELIFFDALPIEPVPMQVDIMTPHMGDWYQDGGTISRVSTQPERVPADWHNPVPVPFLVVKQARFLFTVASRTRNTTISLSEVMQALEQALQWLGAGAKTAVGYGQMKPYPAALDQLQQASDRRLQAQKIAEARADMTPFERDLDDRMRQADNPPVVLLQALQAGTWTNPDEQKQVAEKAKALWQAEKKWIPDFNGKNKQKIKQQKRCQALKEYLSN